MWQAKHGTGQLSPGDLVRSPAKTECYYQTGDHIRLAVMIQSYATKTKAQLTFITLYAYTPKGKAITLLHVTVKTPGQPRQRRGPKV